MKHVNAVPRRATLVGVAPPYRTARQADAQARVRQAVAEDAIIAEARRELAAKYFWRAAKVGL